jgi:hypothetical protein
MNRIAILAVVKYRDTIRIVGKVGPLMATDFKLGSFPRGVIVSWASMVTKLSFVCSRVGVNIYWKLSLEELVSLVPINCAVKLDIGRRWSA